MALYILKFENGGNSSEAKLERMMFKTASKEIDAEDLAKNYENYLREYAKSQNLTGKDYDNFLYAAAEVQDGIKNGTLTRGNGLRYSGVGLVDGNKYLLHALNALDNLIEVAPDKNGSTDEELEKFNINGVHNFWKNKFYGGADGDMQDWLDRDVLNEDGTRGNILRRNAYAQMLNEYADSLADKKYDFTGSAHKDMSDYIGKLRHAAQILSDENWDQNDTDVLNAIGVNKTFRDQLFGNGEVKEEELDPGSFEALYNALKKQLEKDVKSGIITQEEMNQELADFREKYRNSKYGENLWNRDFLNFKDLHWLGGNNQLFANFLQNNWDDSYASIWDGNSELDEGARKLPWLSNKTNANYADKLYDRAIHGHLIDMNAPGGDGQLNNGAILYGYMHEVIKNAPDKLTKVDGTNKYFINSTFDLNAGTAVIYNADTNKMTKIHVDPSNTPVLRAKLEQMYKAKHPQSFSSSSGSRWAKNGGKMDDLIKLRKGGEVIKAGLGADLGQIKLAENNALYNNAVQQEADAKGLTTDQVKVGHAKAFRTESGNKERGIKEGLDNSDWLRIASLGQDIASVGASYAGPYGTAVAGGLGVTSMLTDLAADITDDSVSSGEVWGNLGTNALITAAGMFPGGTGKFAKIWRNAKKLAPTILALYGATTSVMDPEIQKSFKKLMGSGSENSLTTNDWKNISRTIKMVAFAHNTSKGTAQAYNDILKGSKIPGTGALAKWGTAGSSKQFKYGNYKRVFGDAVKEVKGKYQIEIGGEKVLLSEAQSKEFAQHVDAAAKQKDSSPDSMRLAANNLISKWIKSGSIKKSNGSAFTGTTGSNTFEHYKLKAFDTEQIKTLGDSDEFVFKTEKGDVKVNGKIAKNVADAYTLELAASSDATKALQAAQSTWEGTANIPLIEVPGQMTYPEITSDLDFQGMYDASHGWFHKLKRNPELLKEFRQNGLAAPELDGFAIRDTNGRLILDDAARRSVAEHNLRARVNARNDSLNWVENGGGFSDYLNPLNWLGKTGRQWQAEHFNNNWEVANGAGIFANAQTLQNYENAKRNQRGIRNYDALEKGLKQMKDNKLRTRTILENLRNRIYYEGLGKDKIMLEDLALKAGKPGFGPGKVLVNEPTLRGNGIVDKFSINEQLARANEVNERVFTPEDLRLREGKIASERYIDLAGLTDEKAAAKLEGLRGKLGLGENASLQEIRQRLWELNKENNQGNNNGGFAQTKKVKTFVQEWSRKEKAAAYTRNFELFVSENNPIISRAEAVRGKKLTQPELKKLFATHQSNMKLLDEYTKSNGLKLTDQEKQLVLNAHADPNLPFNPGHIDSIIKPRELGEFKDSLVGLEMIRRGIIKGTDPLSLLNAFDTYNNNLNVVNNYKFKSGPRTGEGLTPEEIQEFMSSEGIGKKPVTDATIEKYFDPKNVTKRALVREAIDFLNGKEGDNIFTKRFGETGNATSAVRDYETYKKNKVAVEEAKRRYGDAFSEDDYNEVLKYSDKEIEPTAMQSELISAKDKRETRLWLEDSENNALVKLRIQNLGIDIEHLTIAERELTMLDTAQEIRTREETADVWLDKFLKSQKIDRSDPRYSELITKLEQRKRDILTLEDRKFKPQNSGFSTVLLLHNELLLVRSIMADPEFTQWAREHSYNINSESPISAVLTAHAEYVKELNEIENDKFNTTVFDLFNNRKLNNKQQADAITELRLTQILKRAGFSQLLIDVFKNDVEYRNTKIGLLIKNLLKSATSESTLKAQLEDLSALKSAFLMKKNGGKLDAMRQIRESRFANINYNKTGGKTVVNDYNLKLRDREHARLVKQVLAGITHHEKALENLSKGLLLSIKKALES